MRNWLAALLLFLTFVPGPAQAQTYRWVDEAGAVHYTQGLESIPERYRSRARLLDLGPVPPSPAPDYKLPAPPWATKWEPSGPLPEITRVPFPHGSRILADVTINGQGPVKLLLDTGAYHTTVSAQAIRALGISAPSYPCRSCENKYIGGAVRVDEVQILSVKVGEAEMTGPVFIEEGENSHLVGIVGILGRSFLDNFRMTIDSRRQWVILGPTTISDSGKHEASFAPPHVARIPFRPHPKILVTGTVNGRGPITLVLDTGASNTWLAAGALQRLGVSTENGQSRTWQGHGREVRIIDMDVDSVEVAGAKAGPLRISVFADMETTMSGLDGLLGLDFLRNFTVTIDPVERVVTLEGPDNPSSPPGRTHPREPSVTREGPGNLQVPSAVPTQRGRWLWVGLAALAVLGLCARRMILRRRTESVPGSDRTLGQHPGASRPPVCRGHLKCPRCSRRLDKLDTEEGIAVHWCEVCKGTWHDKGILDEFSRLSGLPELLQKKPVFSQPSDRLCPRCEVPMERIGFGEVKFAVERCRSCQGLWLDPGEKPQVSAAEKAKLDEIVARVRARAAHEPP